MDKIVFVIDKVDDKIISFAKKWLKRYSPSKYQDNFTFVFTKTIPETTQKDLFTELGIDLSENDFIQIIKYELPTQNGNEIFKILSSYPAHRIQV